MPKLIHRVAPALSFYTRFRAAGPSANGKPATLQGRYGSRIDAAVRVIPIPVDVPPCTDSGVSGDFSGVGGAIGEVARFFAEYMVLPDLSILAMSAWVQAAHFIDAETKGPWDQFPILAVTSPEKRCGKSTLLDLLSFITPRADEGKFINPSPAAFYRAIEKSRPTIIMDESQSLKRRASESSEVLREMLNASIRRDEAVVRCVGDNHEPTKFSIYSPKVFAQIGDPDGVLADRCLPIRLERKTNEAVKKYRYSKAKERGEQVRTQLQEWAEANAERVGEVYARLEPFDIDNDRMADLLMPLQAVLIVAGGESLASLERYARSLDERDREREMQSPGIQMLTACREIFRQKRKDFIWTQELIASLIARQEEPWAEFNNGKPINDVRLARLLRDFQIKSRRDKDQKHSGYFAVHFRDAWTRYLPPEIPANPANPARTAPSRPAGYAEMLRTPYWMVFSRRVREHWGNRCAVCYAEKPLQVHHRTYERLGREELTDCLPLCEGCHPFADAARQEAKP